MVSSLDHILDPHPDDGPQPVFDLPQLGIAEHMGLAYERFEPEHYWVAPDPDSEDPKCNELMGFPGIGCCVYQKNKIKLAVQGIYGEEYGAYISQEWA